MRKRRPLLSRIRIPALGLLFWTLSALGAGPEILVVTDTEGRRDNLMTLVEEKKLKFDETTGLDFTRPDQVFVFGGDLSDRGTDSIRLRKWLVVLKKKYPDRVTFIWGNRDLNKLKIVQSLPDLQNLRNNDYISWLRKAAGPEASEAAVRALNTPENQLRFMHQKFGIPDALELHRRELTEILGKPVTSADAADHYLSGLRAGGEQMEFLRLGQIMDIRGDRIFTHGGLSRSNYGYVPGLSDRFEDPRKWKKELNKFGETEMARLAEGAHESPLLAYGDSLWNPETATNFNNDVSVIYPPRHISGDNLMLSDEYVRRQLQKHGLNTEVVGHIPAGNVPLLQRGSDGFSKVYADTSYGPNGGHSSVCFPGDGEIEIHGQVGKERVGFRARTGPQAVMDDPYLGRMLDGYHISKAEDGRYVLIRYVNRHQLDEKVVDAAYLKANESRLTMATTLSPEFNRPGTAQSIATIVDGKVTIETVDAKGAPFRREFKAGEDVFEGQFLNGEFICRDGKGGYERISFKGGVVHSVTPIGKTELEAARDSLRPAAFGFDGDVVKRRTGLIDGLEKKGVRVLSVEEFQDQVLKGRKLFFFSGASKFSGANVNEATLVVDVEKMFDALDKRGGPSKFVISTGATDYGYEKLIHQAAARRGYDIHGFATSMSSSNEINFARTVTILADDWDNGVPRAVEVVKECGGKIIFGGGGGGVVKKAIQRAHEVGADFALGAGFAAPDKSASDFFALHFPSRAYGDSAGMEVQLRDQKRLRIGVYIGSFDPPHAGHRAVLEEMKRKYNLDVVYVVPDRVTSYKPGMMSITHRTRMSELMFGDIPGVRVMTDEMAARMPGAEMPEVLKGIMAENRGAEVFNMMGTDTLDWYLKLPIEKRPQGVTLLVNRRDMSYSIPPSSSEAVISGVEVEAGSSLSSTGVRKAIRAGEAHEELSESVMRYIRENHLYDVPASVPPRDVGDVVGEVMSGGASTQPARDTEAAKAARLLAAAREVQTENLKILKEAEEKLKAYAEAMKELEALRAHVKSGASLPEASARRLADLEARVGPLKADVRQLLKIQGVAEERVVSQAALVTEAFLAGDRAVLKELLEGGQESAGEATRLAKAMPLSQNLLKILSGVGAIGVGYQIYDRAKGAASAAEGARAPYDPRGSLEDLEKK